MKIVNIMLCLLAVANLPTVIFYGIRAGAFFLILFELLLATQICNEVLYE